MLRFIVGMALGFLSGYLYGSERARDEARRRLANAPEPVRRATERVSGAIASAPLPETVKQTASRATASIQTAVQQTGQGGTPAPNVARPTAVEVAGRPAEPLPRIEPESPAGPPA
jgi:hypothetical protein